MLFNSRSFLLLFLPAVVILNGILRAHGSVAAKKWLLLIASLAFYVSFGLQALPVLLVSLLMNWLIAHRIHQSVVATLSRRRWLVLGLTLNVALLVAVKYTGFLADNINALGHWHLAPPAFVLPLGVSFFTLQQIMYLVDCYEELVGPAPLFDHAIFISLFPYITAGPIVRAGALVPQLEARGPQSDSGLATGLFLLAVGLCKKVVLADTFGRFADAGFPATGSALGLIGGWVAGLSYTFQLYFDFSGYTDMALGIGLMLGLVLPENFNSPLKSASIIEFWRRWHITLSNFITTYMYTPMIRRLRPITFRKAMAVTVLVMTIVGIWHGAAWTFLVFGTLHGLALVTNHVWRKTKIRLPRAIGWALTFVFLVVSFVVFRAHGWGQAIAVLSGMAGLHGLGGLGSFAGISRLYRSWCYPVMLAGVAIAFGLRNSGEFARSFQPSWRWSFACAAALVIGLLFVNSSATTAFIYRGF